MSAILMLGAGGFVGAHLANSLSLMNKREGEKEGGVWYLQICISDMTDSPKVLKF